MILNSPSRNIKKKIEDKFSKKILEKTEKNWKKINLLKKISKTFFQKLEKKFRKKI